MHAIKKTTLLAIASLCANGAIQATAQTKAPPTHRRSCLFKPQRM